MRVLLVLLAALGLYALSALSPELAHAQPLTTRCQTEFGGAATTNGQECVVRYSEVIMADNWENRTVGTCSPTNTTFKGPSRPPFVDTPGVPIGWDGGGCDVTPVLASSVGIPAPDGAKILQLHYPPIIAPAQGGSGFRDSFFPGCGLNNPATCPTTVYVRWYSRWGSNFLFSGANTKNVQMFSGASGSNSALHIGHGSNDTTTQFTRRQIGSNPQAGLPTGCANGGLVCHQNVGTVVSVVNDQWYCIEFRLTMNSTPTTPDGSQEMWIDDVLKMSYLNNQLLDVGGKWTGVRITGSGFADDGDYPDMNRYVDRLVVATSRIGCGIISGGGSLNAPANLQLCSGPGCNPALVVPLGALGGLLAWARRRLKRGA